MRPTIDQAVVVDFETVQDETYSLKRMSARRYITDGRFMVLSVAVAVGTGPIRVFHVNGGAAGGIEAGIATIREALPNRVLVVHNAGFDALILKLRYGVEPERVFDTTGYAAYLSIGAGLANVAHYVGLEKFEAPPFSLESLADPAQLAQFARYNANDVKITRRFFQRAIDDRNLPDAEFDTINLTVQANLRGLTIDAERAQAVGVAAGDERAAALADLAKAHPDFDTTRLGSNDAVHKYIQARFGVALPSLRKDDFEALNVMVANPELNEFMRRRRLVMSLGKASKLVERFAAAAPQVFFPLKYYAAHTGRFGGSGRDAEKVNIHSLPKSSRAPAPAIAAMRSIIVPEPGQTFAAADLSTIEARVIAVLAAEERLVERFRRNEDIYIWLASKVFPGVTIKKNGENDHLRRLAKEAVLGLGFGMGLKTFERRVQMVDSRVASNDIKQIFEAYRSEFSKVLDLRRDYWRAFKAAVEWKKHSTVARCDFEIVATKTGGPTVRVRLPTGRCLFYRSVETTPGVTPYGPTTDFWYAAGYEHVVTAGRGSGRAGSQRKFPDGRVRLLLSAPMLVENIVQAVARDVLVHQMLELDRQGIRSVFHVHDELVVAAGACACPGEQHQPDCKWEAGLTQLLGVMSRIPDSLPGVRDIPVSAEANRSVRLSYAG